MSTLLLEPHQDDAILFASFTCLRHRPLVVTVLGDARNQPGVTGAMRDEENARAFRELGLEPPVSWNYRDDDPDWADIESDFTALALRDFDRVYAPWPEAEGHDQHNRIGIMAQGILGKNRISYYTTYKFGGPKTRGPLIEQRRLKVIANEVIPEPDWVMRKHRALACFGSQITVGPRRFFMEDLREYVVEP